MKINPNASVRVESTGVAPVLYIDNFYADPDAVRSEALKANYDLSVAFYPGRHAPLASERYAQAARVISTVATRLGDRRYNPEDFRSDFSIVTTRPDDLLPSQAHPHIDPTPVLGLVYLTPDSREGTSFYYSEYLGTSVITSPEQLARHTEFLQSRGDEFAPVGYNLDGHAIWRRLYTIEPIYNRFVMYPGNAFHAVDIKHVDDEIDMTRVRITQRFIVEATYEK